MRLTAFFAATLFASTIGSAQSFTNSSAQLGASFNSGGCVGVTDMDGDGRDDIVVLHQSRFLRVFYNTPSGYNLVDYGTISSNQQWGMAIGDIDADGHRDVISGGAYDGVRLMKLTGSGAPQTTTLPNGSMFMQACNVADIDNDGHLDYFACHDDGLSRIWTNDGAGNLVPNSSLIDLTDYDKGTFTNTDHSGNYGSVWSDINHDGHLDLVIAKCRQGVTNPLDPRRINQAWINDGNGNFTEQAVDRGIAIYQQSWTVDFGDVNNDGFFDCLITNHTSTMKLLLNDGNGFFTDITAAAGVADAGFFLQAKMVDFDNDGFLDIIYSGGLHRYYRNNGNLTFTHVPNTFPYSDTMHSFGIGDFNQDGFADLYASYGNGYVSPDNNNPDILWMNNGNANNWIAFDLEGTESNIDAIGTKVYLYGDWGVQVREVRAGESYGIVNTFHPMFGIGSSDAVTQAVIEWPSGVVTTIDNPAINTYHSIVEAICTIPGIEIAANGATSFCNGESVQLTAPAGFTYQWSNGADTQSIEVANSGDYTVVVQNGEGCAGVSNTISIDVVIPQQPVFEIAGELEFCQGGSVSLTASPGLGYAWSNAAETASIEVTESGSYFVWVDEGCGTPLQSEAVSVNVLSAPEPIIASTIDVPAQQETTVFAAGSDVEWFDAQDAANPVAVGNQINVNLSEPTTFWVENTTVYGGATALGGKASTTTDGGQFHTNSSFWLTFDAHEDIFIESVQVFAGTAASRTIALVDANGQTIQSTTVSIPAGQQTVQLNFFVPQGTGYGLRSIGNNPQLWRDGPPAAIGFPYQLGNLATITGTNITGENTLAFYYFFYNWQVSTPSTACVSERIPVLLQPITPQDCPGDFDNDGLVSTSDLLLLLANFGCQNDCEADLDGDGSVATGDLLIFLANFGVTCE
ncbi:MAG: FG-GAP-like repeat-containing protein [Flavobacteriales bacterium]